MTNLRKEARGRECMIRSVVCSHNPEETVLAHIRMAGISGMGIKAPDLLGAWSCARCHTLVDTGRYALEDSEGRELYSVELTRDDRDLLLLKGMARTQAALLREGKLLCE
jgi:hypothetical protein